MIGNLVTLVIAVVAAAAAAHWISADVTAYAWTWRDTGLAFLFVVLALHAIGITFDLARDLRRERGR